MPHFVVTYNISDDKSRETIKEKLESKSFPEQNDNQSTHFGTLNSFASLVHFLKQIIDTLTLGKKDFISVYTTALSVEGACDIAKRRIVVNGNFVQG